MRLSGLESWSQRGISILKCSVSQRPKTNAMLTYLLIYVITQGDFTLQNEEIEDIVSPVIPSVQPACTVKAQQSLALLKETQSEGEMFAADKVQNVPCGRVIYEKITLVALLIFHFVHFQ